MDESNKISNPVDDFSDDLIIIEELYRSEITRSMKKNILWKSLIRVYTNIFINSTDYTLNSLVKKYCADLSKSIDVGKVGYKPYFDLILEATFRTNKVPVSVNEVIGEYLNLRQIRNYFTHGEATEKRIEKIYNLGLPRDLDLYGEKEFITIKKIVGKTSNILGLCNFIINNTENEDSKLIFDPEFDLINPKILIDNTHSQISLRVDNGVRLVMVFDKLTGSSKVYSVEDNRKFFK